MPHKISRPPGAALPHGEASAPAAGPADGVPEPPRVLALDPGERRIGVAVSDELGMFAHPLAAVDAREAATPLDAIASLVTLHRVEEVVVGLPLTLAGAASHQARSARAFAEALRGRLRVPVRLRDERLTTAEAVRLRGGRRARGGHGLDSAAAAVLLQSLLDERRRGVAP